MQALQACNDECEGAMTFMMAMDPQGEQGEQTEEEGLAFTCANIEVVTCLMGSPACATLMEDTEAAADGSGASGAENAQAAAAEAAVDDALRVMATAMLMASCGDMGGMAGMMAGMMVSPQCQAVCDGWLDAMTALIALSLPDSMDAMVEDSSPSSGPGPAPPDAVLMPVVCGREVDFRCYLRNEATVCNIPSEGDGSATPVQGITDSLSRCDAWRASGNGGDDSAATSLSALGTVFLALMVVCAAS